MGDDPGAAAARPETASGRHPRPLRDRRPGPGLLGVASNLAPGALLGCLLALQIFFLNPHLPFTPLKVVRGVAIYGLSGGLVSALLLLPWTAGRPRRAMRLLPWGLTLALALGATLSWVHASHYAYFLPSGINVRLIRAAGLLSLSALIGFYTALLHSLAHRRYGPRSRLAYILLAVASIYVLTERRSAFSPPVEPVRRPLAVEGEPRPRLMVVGLDGATFDAILPLAEQGVLPFLSRVIEGGSYGHLGSLRPNRSGSLWTTLATGKLPFRHGIVGREVFPTPALGPGLELRLLPPFEPFRDWASLGAAGRPVDARNRRVLPLWEILTRLGVSTGVVGWPVTAPVPRNLSFALSRDYFEGSHLEENAWPPDIAQRGRLFQVRPQHLDPGLLGALDPPPPDRVLQALAGDVWRQSLTTFLLEQQREMGAVFLVLPGLRSVSQRTFGGYNAVQFEGLQRAPYVEAAEILRAYYAHLDGALEGLWERQEGPCLLAVVSAYGTASASGWQRLKAELSERRSLGGYFDESPDGVFLLYGEGIQPQSRMDGAALVDVVPTLLYALGFPIARDLEGQVRREAFEPGFLARHPLTFLPSYEALPPP